MCASGSSRSCPGLLIENLISELIGEAPDVRLAHRRIDDAAARRPAHAEARCRDRTLLDGTDPCRPHAGDAVSRRRPACWCMRRIRSFERSGSGLRISRGVVWLLPPRARPVEWRSTRRSSRQGCRPPVATVEAWSTKIIHLTISANSRMLGIVPSDVGHDIQRLGGVRHLPFPGVAEHAARRAGLGDAASRHARRSEPQEQRPRHPAQAARRAMTTRCALQGRFVGVSARRTGVRYSAFSATRHAALRLAGIDALA